MITEADCIEALREAAQILGKSPTKAEYEDLDITPSASTILRHCDGWNDAKEQAGLETNFSRGKRVQGKPDDVELPDGMEWAELSQDQRWHYRHKDENAERTLQRRAELRQWLHTLKSSSDGCSECDESDPACLDFHHLDGEDKEADVNKMVPRGYSKADIRAEVEKCELICANCHWKSHHTASDYMDSIEHVADPRESLENRATEEVATQLATAEILLTKEERIRAWTHAYKRARGCHRCNEDTAICLQFHHDGEKRLGVGQMISDSYPIAEVLAEVEKCVVLCANCHRKEHYEVVPGESPSQK